MLDEQTGRYRLRDIKLATNLNAHREIMLQIGLYRIAAADFLGYDPDTEVVAGDGSLLHMEPAAEDVVRYAIQQIRDIRALPSEPWEPVGWSKCEACVFRAECWDKALDALDVATVPYVDQGACRALRDIGIVQHQQLHEFSEELLVSLERPWGTRTQRVGPSAAHKIKRQVKALVEREAVVS